MKINKSSAFLIIIILSFCMMPFYKKLQGPLQRVILTLKGKKSIFNRIDQYGPTVKNRLVPDFKKIGILYPPNKLILVGLKEEQLLEIWVSNRGENPKLLKSYPILGTSGTLGPKLREGDLQVPEGIYQIESLNPNSRFHLALRVNYPNAFDILNGTLDGRSNLGSDIMIHGKKASIGCLAMGDVAAEDLFILAAETGVENISVILSPVDFRKKKLPDSLPELPKWSNLLYETIKNELMELTSARALS